MSALIDQETVNVVRCNGCQERLTYDGLVLFFSDPQIEGNEHLPILQDEEWRVEEDAHWCSMCQMIEHAFVGDGPECTRCGLVPDEHDVQGSVTISNIEGPVLEPPLDMDIIEHMESNDD